MLKGPLFNLWYDTEGYHEENKGDTNGEETAARSVGVFYSEDSPVCVLWKEHYGGPSLSLLLRYRRL